jgi:hypothetical protein
VDDVEGVPTAEDVELGGGDATRWWSGLGGGGKAKGARMGTAAVAVAREKEARLARRRRRRKCCGIVWADLNKRQKWTVGIYLTMVAASLVAVGLITRDYVLDLVKPNASLQIEVLDSIPAPIMTVCTSMRGLPASRLQMFNYSDASGEVFVGTDPHGPQQERGSAAFEAVVERWFDNPDGECVGCLWWGVGGGRAAWVCVGACGCADSVCCDCVVLCSAGEDCLATVGDFFPLPIESLNAIASGKRKTRCRPCFRTGSRGPPVQVTSTDFEKASYASFYTDAYFLQCLHQAGGLEAEYSLPFCQDTIFKVRQKMADYGLLNTTSGVSVAALPAGAFNNITSPQACSVLFFAFFPRDLGRSDPRVDIKYTYDGTKWSKSGGGPYFQPPTAARGLLLQEALEVYISTKETTPKGRLPDTSDLALVGPNSQAFLRLRPVVVFGKDRYDISVSASNFVQDSLKPLFGYCAFDSLLLAACPRRSSRPQADSRFRVLRGAAVELLRRHRAALRHIHRVPAPDTGPDCRVARVPHRAVAC